MTFGNNEESMCYKYCEKCRAKVPAGEGITVYGPEQVTWFDGGFKDMAHYYCSDQCAKDV